MAGTALTDAKAAVTAIVAGDQSIGLAVGLNVTDQLTAVETKITDAALMVYDVQQVGILGGGYATALVNALATLATDLT